MKIITITIDETQQSQTIYSPDLDKYLRIYALVQTDLDTEAQEAQAKISMAQAIIDAANALSQTRQAQVQQAQP